MDVRLHVVSCLAGAFIQRRCAGPIKDRGPEKGGEVYQRSQGAQGERATDPEGPRLALAVAVPGPFRGALTYGLDGQPSPPFPGSRVRVP